MTEMTGPKHERYCAAVEAEVARFVGLVAAADPTTPVPTCPGWTIADLVKHHGTTHRWVEHLVRHRATERIWSRDVPLDLPENESQYPAWLAAGGSAALRTLRAAGPDTPVWSHGADQHVRFWPRRLLFEAVVHLADAELALGRRPQIDGETAADGVDELLQHLPFAARVAENIRQLGLDGEAVHLYATDTGTEWVIKIGGGGFTWERGHSEGTATARATAGDLLLLVYGRLRPEHERITTAGDRELLASWLAATAL
jgi:uncharacterized protein (TIGR03083 family)